MNDSALTDMLVLLAATVLLVTVMRRLRLPAILGFLSVGMALGPYALALVPDTAATRTLAEFGVVFLLFTLGLEFSLPRMLAMRREVFGLGSLQMLLTILAVAGIAVLAGVRAEVAVVLGGAVAMSSTAILMTQLNEQAEINRTHGRLAFGILLFQDLAFVPLLALAGALSISSGAFDASTTLLAVGKAAVALLIVLATGRWLLRPLFAEIAHSRAPELFTMAVLLVAIGSSWATHAVGLSLALGAFLAGMMLAETEYRYQVEAGIRPFRDILLGLFFVTVGMQLDVTLLARETLLVLSMLGGLLCVKAAAATLAARPFAGTTFKAVRTGVVLSVGGEFGFALLTVLMQGRLVDPAITQPLLAAIVLSMVLSPAVIGNNKRITRFLLRQVGPDNTALARESARTLDVARRDHVILCGYGRVGQNVARVLESQGFEFLAMDMEPFRVRMARQAGDNVIYGDASDEAMLHAAGLEHASAVVVTFADPERSLSITRAVRRVRRDVPILVRTQDDTKLDQLTAAGATEVVPETFEAALMLVSQTLLLLKVPVSRVVRTLADIRAHRYSVLRSIFRREGAARIDADHSLREELHTVVLPPGAWGVGRSLEELRSRGAQVSFTAIRRDGIVGRDPAPGTVLREGDVVVIYGTPEALEHGEAVLLAG
jgi:CPA2 family monovalent cation:H+ antiporter-2